MRSNGLTARAYTPITDLDPRVAGALLDELKEQGVAAYTKPIESSSTMGFDRPEFRVDVKERLYVDTAASAQVRDLISAKDPALIDESDDLTWAQIVAGFDLPMTSPVAPWPANEDVDETEDSDAADVPDDRRVPAAEDPQDAMAGAATAKVRAPDSEDRFVPDPPPPLPKLEPYKLAAWIGLIGGPALLVLSALFALTLPVWLSVLAVGGFVGGFVTLVATMKDRSDADGDPDNGAVV
ncbi:MAG: hypothetical protein H0U28_07760 [Nocardioidaceae bacterium]|nr:hypothetical protein [Nocardioidaceae bacterium]